MTKDFADFLDCHAAKKPHLDQPCLLRILLRVSDEDVAAQRLHTVRQHQRALLSGDSHDRRDVLNDAGFIIRIHDRDEFGVRPN